jgi:membrane-associated phospholipid phosphatase
MKIFFHNFFGNLRRCFWGKNLLFHLLAIVLTFIIVRSNLDWFYFAYFLNTKIYNFLFPGIIIGGLTPIIVPAYFYISGAVRRNMRYTIVGDALAQSTILGFLISTTYKSLTGRIPPPYINSGTNVSHGFHFSLFHGNLFWGWPSSHTTIAFATGFCLIYLFPKSKLVRIFAPLYALYIGLSVSMTIHWLSEFTAGAIIGIMIGRIVGKSFHKRYSEQLKLKHV